MSEIKNNKQESVWLDDRLVRLIGVPFFGIVIPSSTGLLKLDALLAWETALHYLYFILIAGVVWEGNRWLLFRYYPVFFASNSVLQKYVLMIGLNVLFTAPISLLMLFGWKWATGDITIPKETLFATMAITVVCVIFVTNVYEKVLFAKHSDNEKLKIEQLEQAKVLAELEALKNQVDPHFMFNTLNSLSFLVEHDAERAQQFIENLADVYRYILKSKEKDLVLLEDEVSFMKAYVGLMQLRHEEAFTINLKLNDAQKHSYLIPPVSMMVALENAVKHNEVSKSSPLIVDVLQDADNILISNLISVRKIARESTQVGLKNLNDRFEKTLGLSIEIDKENNRFTLRLPLLKLQQA